MSRASIVLDVPLETNSVIDFNELAVSKYGFEAVHPNAVAADDLLVDDDVDDADDGEPDEADAEDKEPQQEKEGTEREDKDNADATPDKDAPQPSRRKGKRMVGKYDLNDPFIDDAEMQWEANAAATKDGFFVYSGNFELQTAASAPEKDGKKAGKRKNAADSGQQPKRRKQTKKSAKDDTKETTKETNEGKPVSKSSDPEKPLAVDSEAKEDNTEPADESVLNAEEPLPGMSKETQDPKDASEMKDNKEKPAKEPKHSKEPKQAKAKESKDPMPASKEAKSKATKDTKSSEDAAPQKKVAEAPESIEPLQEPLQQLPSQSPQPETPASTT